MILSRKNSTAFDRLIKQSNNFLNNEKNKEKAVAYIYIILSLFAISFFGIFAIGPTLTTITELNKEYEEKKLVLEKLKEKNQILANLGNQYQSISGDYPLITNAIPKSPNASKLTRQLEILASQNGLSIDRIDVAILEVFPAINESSPIFSYAFTVTVRGGQSNVNSFLSQIISIDRLIEIQRLTTGEDREGFSAVFTGKAFFYK